MRSAYDGAMTGQCASNLGRREKTDRRQFGHHHCHRGQKVDHKQTQIVTSVMCAHQEQTNWHGHEEFLRRCVLVFVVDLFPHVQVVVRAGVEFERDSANVVEHEICGEHVGGVDEGPAGLLGD